MSARLPAPPTAPHPHLSASPHCLSPSSPHGAPTAARSSAPPASSHSRFFFPPSQRSRSRSLAHIDGAFHSRPGAPVTARSESGSAQQSARPKATGLLARRLDRLDDGQGVEVDGEPRAARAEFPARAARGGSCSATTTAGLAADGARAARRSPRGPPGSTHNAAPFGAPSPRARERHLGACGAALARATRRPGSAGPAVCARCRQARRRRRPRAHRQVTEYGRLPEGPRPASPPPRLATAEPRILAETSPSHLRYSATRRPRPPTNTSTIYLPRTLGPAHST